MKRRMVPKLAAAILLSAIGSIWPANSSQAADQPSAVKQTILVQEAGQPARKCIVVSMAKRSDGTIVYVVKAADNGELLTIQDKSATIAGAKGKVETSPPPLVKTDVSLTLPPVKDRETDPLLNIPPDSKRGLSNAQPIVSNVDQTVMPVPPAAKSSTPESHGILSWFSGSKSQASAKATPTVSSATPSLPVVDTSAGKANLGIPMAGAVPVYANPMPMMRPMPAPAPVYLPREVQYQNTLKDSLQPSERELAAMNLCDVPNAKSAAVKGALFTAAKEDPAATVRACCLRCLVKIAPDDLKVRDTLAAAKDDEDVRVRNQASELLTQLKK